MARVVRILFVEDNADDVYLAEMSLRRAGLTSESRTARNEHELRKELSSWNPHVVVSDLFIPAFDGITAFELVKTLSPTTPFLFLSGAVKGRLAAKAIERGAAAYIEKGDHVSFVAAVLEAIRQESS